MKLLSTTLLLAGFFLLSPHPVSAAGGSPAIAEPATQRQLDELVEPIALYPDILLQAMLPAATFPDQIVDAALLIKGPDDAQRIKTQTWDPSVKAIAGYPGVLKMMFERIDWTSSLGHAFLDQHEDLLRAIQRARISAQQSGDLKTTQQQKVTSETVGGTTIVQIVPTQPDVVYVPSTQSSSSSSALVPLATFGLGLALGSAMSDDDDVNVYYHGWGGPAFWHGGNAYNQWQDNRRAVWEDYNNRMSDKQDFRQDYAKDRQEFRQDMYEQGKVPSDASRQKYQQQAQAYKLNNPEKAAQRQQQAQAYKQNNPQKSAQASQRRASMQSTASERGWSSGSMQSQNSAFAGGSSRAQATRAGGRGSVEIANDRSVEYNALMKASPVLSSGSCPRVNRLRGAFAPTCFACPARPPSVDP